MRKIITSPYDVVDYLRDEEDIAAYLEAALEDSDAELIAHVQKEIIRAREHLRQRAS
ncbi:MAG TPA: hypothetical protein VH105_16050 [Burkholderiales bacterium]|jgi:probable addiction module antidote protein|nr:hypothetical protein [Burkholderiales bacterium]